MLKKDTVFLEIATKIAELSKCRKKKVGCVAVKDKRIVAMGYNGTAPGQPNECEDVEGNTLPTVSHAEANMVAFCAKNGISLDGCDLYVTMSPCPTCANLIIHAGIQSIFFIEIYRNEEGIRLLDRLGRKIQRSKDDDMAES